MKEANDHSAPQTRPKPGIEQIDILWLTAGLSCDGDTISITAATQPSLEDLLLGALPGLPQVRLHNPVLAYANGDDFLRICGFDEAFCEYGHEDVDFAVRLGRAGLKGKWATFAATLLHLDHGRGTPGAASHA